ncbi:5-hydroxytryptamine receptor [Holothuria leucospilota]|uniref:5-hydroxytryptamine receptor n=1 Tax=Holothuria leucospilota TaxID=206669 RepID=A0A9Q1BWL1_HOLLE|nr:5-hydroxytryptamine receptor [Holothuria leucospilota]
MSSDQIFVEGNFSQDINSTDPSLFSNRNDYDGGTITGHVTGWRLAFVLFIAVVIGIIIFGNILTLIAIFNCRTLRTTANLLVISLAIADLTVATGVMPLSLAKEISPNGTLGHPLCDIWVSLDVLSCTASILNLCIISLDRYWSITCPFTYNKKRTTKHMLLMISLVWIVSTIISVAPLFGWKTPQEKNEPSCQVTQDKYYTIFSTFVAFFIPMTIMLVVYWLIFLEAKRRIRGESFSKYNKTSQVLEGSLSQLPPSFHMRSYTNTGNGNDSAVTTSLIDQFNADKLPIDSVKSDPELNWEDPPPKRQKRTLSLPASKTSASFVALRKFQAEKQTIIAAKEQKAAKTLAIVTGVFLVCWLPFFSLALLIPFCPSCEVPWWCQSLVLWLGYFNSMMNPIIYTKFNPEFQKAFHKTLHCRGGRYS